MDDIKLIEEWKDSLTLIEAIPDEFNAAVLLEKYDDDSSDAYLIEEYGKGINAE